MIPNCFPWQINRHINGAKVRRTAHNYPVRKMKQFRTNNLFFDSFDYRLLFFFFRWQERYSVIGLRNYGCGSFGPLNCFMKCSFPTSFGNSCLLVAFDCTQNDDSQPFGWELAINCICNVLYSLFSLYVRVRVYNIMLRRITYCEKHYIFIILECSTFIRLTRKY